MLWIFIIFDLIWWLNYIFIVDMVLGDIYIWWFFNVKLFFLFFLGLVDILYIKVYFVFMVFENIDLKNKK